MKCNKQCGRIVDENDLKKNGQQHKTCRRCRERYQTKPRERTSPSKTELDIPTMGLEALQNHNDEYFYEIPGVIF